MISCSPDDLGQGDVVPPVPEPVLPELEPAPQYVPEIYINVEDGEIAAGDDNYNFITGYMNDFFDHRVRLMDDFLKK